MLPDSGKPRQIPPSELIVRKFAESRSSELQALHSLLSNRINNDFRSQRNKRRRTTSHDHRIAKKRCRNTTPSSDKAHGEKQQQQLSRRLRRTIELKKNPESGFGVSGDGTRRLRTHVWLAKRFEMVKRWGFYVPLGLHGRGRGSRAILKKLKTGVLLHDASYYSTVQLEGSQESLLSILTSVFVPAPSINVENYHQVLSGDTFGSAMLYHAGKESLRPVAPVTYMFRPVPQISSITECLSTNVDGGQQEIADVTTIRQLWISIHGAALVEAYDALTSACKSQLDIPGGSVECISLEGQLARLELIGSKALQLLHKTLLLVSSNSEKPEHDDCGELEKMSILKNNDQNSNSVVNSFNVMDPRVITKKESESVNEENHLSSLRKCETKKHVIPSTPDNETECAAGSSSLWDLSKGIRPPNEESTICMEKQHQRVEFIRVGRRNSGTCGTSGEGKYGRWCPMLLLKNKNHKDSVIRYSVIIPLSWTKVFWNAFISNGAHVIGLREKQWIASEIELPCFPLDFPDCNAYTHAMAMEKVITDQKVSLRPTSKKPLAIPIPPPWHSVRLNYDIGSGCGSEDKKLDGMVKHPGYATSEAKMLNNPGFPLEDQIARTSSMLSDFFNTINLDNLYLFPRMPYQKSCTYEVMKHKEIPSQETIVSEAEHDKGRCFLRVLLRAYRKGVFEQGAVVCAPLAADMKLLIGSETDNEQLQLPESVLKSYFVRLPSGGWDVQVPEDSAMRQCFRWPIGFVTAGFVRGSKRAAAVAFCEATVLSRLRIEQWRASPAKKRKKEIYVLVRNMRSTTYRLALASIFLEQEEDVEFM